jgi:catechol 2,3-dioxygenase-like lactoylglutathione lyase family enzyme
MVGPIESITVGVRDLDAALAAFRQAVERLGVVADGNASVGLLGAWKRPVHETVRLVELAAPATARARIRLAHFENDIEEAGDLAVQITHEAAVVACIAVANLPKSQRFYVDGLGWQMQDEMRVVDPAGAILKLTQARTDELPPARTPGHTGVNLITCESGDLEAVLERLTALGIEPATRPTHVGLPNGRPGRVMLVHGPVGELFELIEPGA